MRPESEQLAIREDIFRWLDSKLAAGAFEVTRRELLEYRFYGERIPLLDVARGIRNPADFDSTLSIMTSVQSPYGDLATDDGFLRYAYQAKDGGDNVKLRRAFERGNPLVYFQGVRPGAFVAYYPAYIVADLEDEREVVVALEETMRFFGDPLHMNNDERRYADRVVRQRLHQPVFRAHVLRAYQSQCAVCGLKHPQLLDAAHIIPDADTAGRAHVTNGLALCKIHHAAYDTNLMGITPGYEVRVDEALLTEIDGPMLRHGIQDMHGRRIKVPRAAGQRPSVMALEERFERFLAGV